MAENLVATITREQQRSEALPQLQAGDVVKVHVRIREGDKERLQVFEGVIIALSRGGSGNSMTVRKVSRGVGVERVFPINSPAVDKVELVVRNRVRRAKLYYLRKRQGRAARLKELDTRR